MASLKRDVRFLGLDDSPFTFEDQAVRVVGVVTRGATYVEGVLSTHVAIDGNDGTRKLAELIGASRFRPMLRAVFLNGVTMGGFNVIDLDLLHDQIEIPLVSIVRDQPDEVESASALRKHFPDAALRLEVLSRQRPKPVRNGNFKVWCTWRGVKEEEVRALLEASTVRGAIPEPLRLSHVIASGIARGHSRGPV